MESTEILTLIHNLYTKKGHVTKEDIYHLYIQSMEIIDKVNKEMEDIKFELYTKL